MMKMTMKTAMVTLSLALATAAVAREVTEAEALRAAQAWARRNATLVGEGATATGAVGVTGEDGSVLYYTVSFANGAVITLASRTELDPILMVVPGGEDMSAEQSDALHDILSADAEAAHAELDASTAETATTATTTSGKLRVKRLAAVVAEPSAEELRWEKLLTATEVETGTSEQSESFKIFNLLEGWQSKTTAEMLTAYKARLTHWDQGGYAESYDLYTPNHWPAGCVAVAGAEALQYFNVTKGPENIKSGYDNQTVLEATYDWSCITMKLSTATNETAKELVGRVLRHLGVLCSMSYSSSGSGATLSSLASALRVTYGFPHVTQRSRYYSSLAIDREKHIYSQLRSGAPVIFGVSGNTGKGDAAHAIIAVGYGEDDANTPFTAFHMGYGSAAVWSALPQIGKSYTIIDDILTLLGPTDEVAAIYGQITGEDGADKTVTICDPDGNVLHTLTTGGLGQYGARVDCNLKYVTVKADGYKTQTVKIADADTKFPDKLDFTDALKGSDDGAVVTPEPETPVVTKTSHGVPHAWLVEKGLAQEGANVADFETVAGNNKAGRPVWHAYVIGCEPNDEKGLAAKIEMKDGKPKISWEPDLGSERKYTVEGTASLDASALKWESYDETKHRFFRVRVELPE